MEEKKKFPINHEEEQGLPSPSRGARWRLWKRWQHASVDDEEALSSKHSSKKDRNIISRNLTQTHRILGKSQLEYSTVQQLLVAVLGNEIEQDEMDEDSSLQQEAYFNFVKQKILGWPHNRFDEILKNGFNPGASGVDGALTLMTKIADCTKMGYDFTIDKTIDKCLESGILSESIEASAERDKARIIIYNCISWISMLYPPLENPLDKSLDRSLDRPLDKPLDEPPDKSPDIATAPINRLAINSTKCGPLIKKSQPLSNAELPICEVIQEFGSLLPVKRNTSSEPQSMTDTVFSKDSFYVSLLNAKNLAQIGGVEIVWIEHVSSHLVFDTDTMRPPRLFVYRFPSFCYLNRSHSSAFAR